MYRVMIITKHDQRQVTCETELQALDLYDRSIGIRVFLHKRIRDGWTLIQRKELESCAFYDLSS